jgi:hypothetical protein
MQRRKFSRETAPHFAAKRLPRVLWAVTPTERTAAASLAEAAGKRLKTDGFLKPNQID